MSLCVHIVSLPSSFLVSLDHYVLTHPEPPLSYFSAFSTNQTNADKMNHLLGASKVAVEAPEVKVIAHDMQRFAVWFGGSMLAVSSNTHTGGGALIVCVEGILMK